MKTLLMSSVAAIFAVGTALAHDPGMDWDTNADGYIDRTEYDAGVSTRVDEQARGMAGKEEVTGWWYDWDDDQDGMISREEIEMFDTDQDGMISREEYDERTWMRYDADQDDRWSADEARHYHGGSDVSK